MENLHQRCLTGHARGLVDGAGGHGVIDGLCKGTNPALPEPIAPEERNARLMQRAVARAVLLVVGEEQKLWFWRSRDRVDIGCEDYICETIDA